MIAWLLPLACENAMKEHQTDLVWLLLPAVFLVAMLGATIFLVVRTHGAKEDGN